MAHLVRATGATGAWVVPTSLSSRPHRSDSLPRRSCLDLRLRGSKPTTRRLDLSFSLSEVTPALLELPSQPIEKATVWSSPVVESSCSMSTPDAPPIDTPTTSHARHIDQTASDPGTDELRTRPMFKLSEHATVDASQHSTVRRRCETCQMTVSDDHTVASDDAESAGIPWPDGPQLSGHQGHFELAVPDAYRIQPLWAIDRVARVLTPARESTRSCGAATSRSSTT